MFRTLFLIGDENSVVQDDGPESGEGLDCVLDGTPDDYESDVSVEYLLKLKHDIVP